MNQAVYENVSLIEPMKILPPEKVNGFLTLCHRTPMMQYNKDSGIFLDEGFSFLQNPSETDKKYIPHYQCLFDTLKEYVPESVLLSSLVLHFEW